MATSFSNRALVLLLAGSLGCGSDLLLPDPPGGGENVELSKVDGDNQIGVVGEQLQKPLKVKVITIREQPVKGREVRFVFTSASGKVTPDTAFTNSVGEAIANWELGSDPGPQTVVAQLPMAEGDPQIEQFNAEARPAPPDTLSAKSAVSQPGRRGQPVGSPPVVRVVDRFGNPVPDVPVAWQVTAGQGQVSEAITRTGPEGTTMVGWTLGNRVGIHRLTASVGPITGSPATFSATVLF